MIAQRSRHDNDHGSATTSQQSTVSWESRGGEQWGVWETGRVFWMLVREEAVFLRSCVKNSGVYLDKVKYLVVILFYNFFYI